MGRATSEKVGRGTCTHVGCGEPVTYRRSSGGMLTYKCDGCDSSGYAEPGGSRYAACMATIKTPATPSPPPELPANRAIPDPKPKPAPAAKPEPVGLLGSL